MQLNQPRNLEEANFVSYVVTEKCIKCKYTDCVEVCPVDCFYEGPEMLAINPEECIDCGVCEPECPIDAIKPESAIKSDQERAKWLVINKHYAGIWPNITEKKETPSDAGQYAKEEGKLEKYFSEALKL